MAVAAVVMAVIVVIAIMRILRNVEIARRRTIVAGITRIIARIVIVVMVSIVPVSIVVVAFIAIMRAWRRWALNKTLRRRRTAAIDRVEADRRGRRSIGFTISGENDPVGEAADLIIAEETADSNTPCAWGAKMPLDLWGCHDGTERESPNVVCIVMLEFEFVSPTGPVGTKP